MGQPDSLKVVEQLSRALEHQNLCSCCTIFVILASKTDHLGLPAITSLQLIQCRCNSHWKDGLQETVLKDFLGLGNLDMNNAFDL